MGKKPSKKQFHKVAIISDIHSNFVDEEAFKLFLQIYSDNHFDELVINGDLLDFPTISSHSRKIDTYNPNIIKNYSLDEELDFTEEQILQPLHRAGKKRPILIRMGNHEIRWLRPITTNAAAISDILATSRRRGALKLDKLLSVDRYNARVSRKDIDILQRRFVLTHGNKLTTTRCRKYLTEFLMSGTSGHTHKGEKAEKTIYGGKHLIWAESYCLRTFHKGVEYMPQGSIPDWAHGFLEVWFDKKSKNIFVKQHRFQSDYSYIYNDTFYKV